MPVRDLETASGLTEPVRILLTILFLIRQWPGRYLPISNECFPRWVSDLIRDSSIRCFQEVIPGEGQENFTIITVGLVVSGRITTDVVMPEHAIRNRAFPII